MGRWQVVFRALADGTEFLVAVIHIVSGGNGHQHHNEDHRVPGKTSESRQAFKQMALEKKTSWNRPKPLPRRGARTATSSLRAT